MTWSGSCANPKYQILNPRQTPNTKHQTPNNKHQTTNHKQQTTNPRQVFILRKHGEVKQDSNPRSPNTKPQILYPET